MSNKMIPVVSPESIDDGIVRKPIMQFDAEFLVSMFDEFAHKKYNHGFDYWIETLTTEDKIKIITKGENLSDSIIDNKYIQECAEFITTKWVGFVPSTKNKIRKNNVN